MHDNFIWNFKDRAFDNSFIDLLKVMNVSDLRWLGDSSTCMKSLPSIVSHSVFSTLSKAAKDQIATYQGPCPSLSCIAMNDYYIFRTLYLLN